MAKDSLLRSTLVWISNTVISCFEGYRRPYPCWYLTHLCTVTLLLIMVSPGTHFVKNHEFQSRANDQSQLKKNKSEIENGLAFLWSFYFKAQQRLKEIYIVKQQLCHRNYTNKIFLQKHVDWSLRSTRHNYELFCVLNIRDAGCRGNKVTVCIVCCHLISTSLMSQVQGHVSTETQIQL